MHPKYSNIFWHEGVKLFSERQLSSKGFGTRVAHLENDVTKSLLNVFQHTDKKVLGAFLKAIGVKDAPASFNYEFQVTDTNKFRSMKNRIMLKIVAEYTPTKPPSSEFVVKHSIPDACIFNDNTAILIEAKTQSPIVQDQIDRHVKHYLGTATRNESVKWEDTAERFKALIKSLKPKDKFVVDQFCRFLDLISLSKFNGFIDSDFSMAGMIGKIPSDDYLDYKRIFSKKLRKFMDLLDKKVKSNMRFKDYDIWIGKINPGHPVSCSAFYFIDEGKKNHVNKYPNINFNFRENGVELSLNAEINPSVRRIVSTIKQKPDEFNRIIKDKSQFNLSVYYRLQYLPMDNFIWNLLPGYPKKLSELTSLKILSSVKQLQQNWDDYKSTLIFQMESGITKHASGRFYNETELNFVKKKNKNPIYACH